MGQRIAIHAAVSQPSDRALGQRLRELVPCDAHREWMLAANLISWWASPETGPSNRVLVTHPHVAPRGAIVATAVLGALYPADKVLLASDASDWWVGDFSPGRFAWRLDDVHAFDDPVACRGAQGLWTVPDDVAAVLA